MTHALQPSRFKARLVCPAVPGDASPWAFVVLPKDVSDRLPRRGRTTVDGTLNGQPFQATLEPDGQLSHWLRVDQVLGDAAGVSAGDTVTLTITPVAVEPEPVVPQDFHQALTAAPAAQAVWNDTTTLARVDWIHWIVIAKQATTRIKRIANACDMLAAGERRVCCFDPSGFYSKALKAPVAAD